ncbi:zinc finger protein 358-like [Atheta coriaria]|uniref:zinc finger protein 358-like n=1 Tax=Dalotia coriaria TaxID=877792 RepID=UPI0031F43422
MKTYSRKKADEQEEVILDLNELCRLCMTKEDQLVSIFENDGPVSLPLRIMACVALEVLEGDGLPNKICHPCKFQLEKSYSFRKKCEGSDVKLRQHVRTLQQKFPDAEFSIERPSIKDDEEEIIPNQTTQEINTERELAGVTQVAYIAPDPEPESHDNITLPTEDDLEHEDKTKIKKNDIGENDYYVVETDDNAADMQMDTNSTHPIMEDQELDFIAEAVKSTLATHPDLNLTGDLQMKVEHEPGKPTQVSVTTDDGSVIVLELTTDEHDQPDYEHADDDDDDSVVNDDGELKVFQCPSCPKSFARRIQLQRHSSVHMQQRGFSCGICEKWFPTRSALIRHERIHTGERPFQCEVCQKSFAQKEILFRHMMTHTGLKPYSCPHCCKGFTQKEPLRAHLKTHLDAGPVDVQLHYCTLCPKVFCHASGLSRHLVTHTGKTFKCRDCDKSFNDKSSLRRHIRQCGHQE